jgi:aspartate/methionine/tyrosine aminotransferase
MRDCSRSVGARTRPPGLHRISRHACPAHHVSRDTYGEQYGADLDPERVIITTGSSAGFVLAFLSLFEAGDRLPSRCPAIHPIGTSSLPGLQAGAHRDHAGDALVDHGELLLHAHRREPLRGVVVASPANPTGTMIAPEALHDLIAAGESADIRIISDEIYHGLNYAFRAESAVKLSENAVIINSFSKYFCMTGWRIGWMVVPRPLVRAIDRLQGNLAISVPTLSQIAAEAAFEAEGRWKPSNTAMRRTGAFCSRACRRRFREDASGGWRLLPLCGRVAVQQ